MVDFYLLTFPRFPLRKKEHKSYFGKNPTHDFRTSRCAAYLLDHSGDMNTKIPGRRAGRQRNVANIDERVEIDGTLNGLRTLKERNACGLAGTLTHTHTHGSPAKKERTMNVRNRKIEACFGGFQLQLEP